MKNVIIVFALTTLFFAGCSKSLDGDCDFKLSTRHVAFGKDASTNAITANSSWMRILCATQGKHSLHGDFEIVCSEDGCTEEHTFFNDTHHLLTITGDWFEIKEISSKEMSISVVKNETGVERILDISFEAGNCFSSVTVTQKAE